MNRIFSLRLNVKSVGAKLTGLTFATLMLGSAAAMADYNAGLQAFNAGNYQVAMKEWTPPAKSGDAQAQHGLGLIYETGRGLAKPDIKEKMLQAGFLVKFEGPAELKARMAREVPAWKEIVDRAGLAKQTP